MGGFLSRSTKRRAIPPPPLTQSVPKGTVKDPIENLYTHLQICTEGILNLKLKCDGMIQADKDEKDILNMCAKNLDPLIKKIESTKALCDAAPVGKAAQQTPALEEIIELTSIILMRLAHVFDDLMKDIKKSKIDKHRCLAVLGMEEGIASRRLEALGEYLGKAPTQMSLRPTNEEWRRIAYERCMGFR